MITHVVLCTPRSDLTTAELASLSTSLGAAVRSIPSVRRFTIGRRVMHGAGYEAAAGRAQFVVFLEFDDLDGLRTYLAHQSHEALGRHFRLSLQEAQAYDFETGGVEVLEMLTPTG